MDRDREWLRISVQGAGGGPLTIRRFLLGAFLGLALLLVLGQALISSRGLREDLISTQQRELRRELELASTLVRGFETQDPDSAARTLAGYLGYPVTFLTAEGQVVGASSDLPFQTRGQTVAPDSPDLRGARAGDVGFAERRGSGEVEIRLFSAIGTTIGGQDLILQVAAPLDEIRRITRNQILQTLGLVLPAILLVTIAAVVLGGILARPLHAITRRILGLIETPVRIRGGLDALEHEHVRGDIEFRGVRFAYHPDAPVLEDVNIRIPAGHNVALVGQTGSGKSTLVKLLLRFHEPVEGRVLVDDRDVHDIVLSDLRRSIGLVSQDVFLFHGTVRENIAY